MTSFSADSDTTDDTSAEDGAQEKPRLDLTVSVESPSACQRHVTVQIPRADVERYFSNAVAEMMPSANVPGFRPGRAPRKLVENHFRKDLKDQIKGNLIYDSLAQVSEDQEFATISEPDFDIDSVKLPDEGPMTFEFDVEVRPEFDLPNWKKLAIDRPVREIAQQDIDERLAEFLNRWTEYEPTGAPVAANDTVTIDLEFRHQNELVASINDVTLLVRKNVSFHDGILYDFDKLIRGATIGDVRESELEIGADCEREELRGETAKATLHLREIMRRKTPELTDDILRQLGNFESVGDLHDAVKSLLERQLLYHQNQNIRQQIASLLSEAADWELPPKLLKSQSERELERAMMELRSSGFSDAEIQTHANVLRQNSQRSTANALREHFLLERIAEEESIDASEEDFDAEILQMALQSNESPRSIRARIEKRGQIDVLRNQIVERKVIELIKSHAKFKDVPYEPSRPTTSAVDFAVGGASATDIPQAKHGGDQEELAQPVDRT